MDQDQSGKFQISDDPADIEDCLALAEHGCDGAPPDEHGFMAAVRGLRAIFSAYPRRPGRLSRYGTASGRGWGMGWPHCQSHSMSAVTGGGVRIAVRKEIAPIVKELLDYAENKLGYSIKSGQCGGFNCRPIGGTQTASNHSWGLAVDINWRENPMSSRFSATIPPELVKAFWKCGFYWGGWYSGGTKYDPMHCEYVGKPSDVARHLKAARKLNGTPTPTATTPASKPKPKVTVSVAKLKAAYEAEGTGEPDPDTKQLQERLSELGYEVGTPDGYYGQRTREALTAFRAKKYGTYAGHPDTMGAPGKESLHDLGFRVVA